MFVESAITQLTVPSNNGNSLRSPGGLLREQFSHGAQARVIDFSAIPLKQLNG